MMLPVKIHILNFGKIRREYSPLISEYEKRLKTLAHIKFEQARKLPDDAILLDSRGVEMSSDEFYKFLKSHTENGRILVFAVGPPDGFQDTRGHFAISLSRLTFRHELAHLILLEQIYRALLRMKGTGYKK